jgi:hypothetical protein
MGETVMDEKIRSVENGYEGTTEYDLPDYEWRWWFNVLGVAIILGIVFVISR